MNKVYLDNASTAFPKASGVSESIKEFIDNSCFNINRGGYGSAYDASMAVIETREAVAELFNFNKPRNVIFTQSITHSLNYIIFGLLNGGGHCIVSDMEHNAVIRPLMMLKDVSFDKISAPEEIPGKVRSDTRLIIINHASNVSGDIFPVKKAAEYARAAGVPIVVDSAQSAGVLPLDIEMFDCIAFTGHKGLLAAQGIGGFVIKDSLAESLTPLISGGTGSFSHIETQPDILPDKFESGTMNLPAIIGLRASLQYLKNIGVEKIHEHEMLLTERFITGVSRIGGLRVIGKRGISLEGRVAVVSLDFPNRDNSEISQILDDQYGIMTRSGLHCSPCAHTVLGTYPHGTVRFSFGHGNAVEDVDYAISSIKEILNS